MLPGIFVERRSAALKVDRSRHFIHILQRTARIGRDQICEVEGIVFQNAYAGSGGDEFTVAFHFVFGVVAAPERE
ncbi:hypothetical protein D3C87_1613270 [compost metagenome]